MVSKMKIQTVRLNLFNHVLPLFRAKFACNTTIRYLVFRWELCKGCVWESVKKFKCVSIQEVSHDWISRLTRDWQLAKMPHVWSMPKAEGSWQLEHYRTKSTIWPDNYLATHLTRKTESPECPVLQKKWLFTFLTYPIINTLIPTKCRELPKRILREKP